MIERLGLAILCTLAVLGAAKAEEVTISISASRLTPGFLEHYGFDCDQLWEMRNGLYARHGYRFRTERGIREFGDGGYTSSPRLSALERENVATIQRFELSKGCLP